MLDIGNGRFIAQSAAIMRYVGKITNLYPKDDYLASVVDSIIDEVRIMLKFDVFSNLIYNRKVIFSLDLEFLDTLVYIYLKNCFVDLVCDFSSIWIRIS